MISTLLVKWHEHLGPSSVYPQSVADAVGCFPPLGLGYLAAVLRKAHYPVELLDVNALKMSEKKFQEVIGRIQPNVIGLTSMSLVWPANVRASQLIKEVLPDCLVVVGGPQLAAYPRESVSFDTIDIGVRGEGEETFLDLVRRLDNKEDITNIPGTVVKKNGKIVVNAERLLVSDINKIPFPARDMMPMDKYHCAVLQKPFVTMLTARGCPYACGFCCKHHWGNTLRQRDPENIVTEMEQIVETYKPKEVLVYDETFTIKRDRIFKICDLIRERKLKIKWDIRTRVNLVDREILKALKSAGCYKIHFGVESGSQKILDKMDKKITLEQVMHAFRIANEIGFETMAYFMIGYPGETLKTIEESIQFAKELNPTWVDISIAIPYPGTDLYNIAMSEKWLDYDYWKEYALCHENGRIRRFAGEDYSEEELEKLLMKFYRKFYFRPSYVLNRVLSLRSLSQAKSYFNGFKALVLANF